MAEKRERDASEEIRKHLMKYGVNKESPAYLARGAELICSQGTNKRMMNLNKCHGVYIKEHAVVHELDCIQGDEENITWFGVCNPGEGLETDNIELIGDNGEKCHGKKCKPYLIGTWYESFEGTRIVDNGDKKQESGEEPEGRNTITTDSFLVCKFGGIITPINSGQDREVSADEFDYETEEEREAALARVQKPCEEEIDREEGCEDLLHAKLSEDDEWSEHGSEFEKEEKKSNFVGYLSYGASGITQNQDEGFFRLYNAPTLSGKGEEYKCNELYKKYNVEPYGALQSFAERARLNISGDIKYGGQVHDPSKGTLIYNGMERYAIAIGPILQNPNCDVYNYGPNDMAYGTCVDISIELDGSTYYIPAIIVDVKAHSAPTGVIQTGIPFNKKDGIFYTGETGPIVEWYVKQEEDGKNKSEGLNQFNRNASIIIYRGEVLY